MTSDFIGANGLIGLTNLSIMLIETDYFPTVDTQLYPALPNQLYISVAAAVIAPISRGNVTLRSTVISDALVVNPNVNLELVVLRLGHRLTCASDHLVPWIVR